MTIPMVKDLSIDGVKLITPTRFEDRRGHFSETFSRRGFCEAVGIDVRFVQDNESLSRSVGTVRGLHIQVGSHSQAKLVRVTAGRALDVVVDLRVDGPSFGRHVAVELDAATGSQVWIPKGFAHGFCTLEPNTVVAYKVTSYYDPAADRTLSWLDRELAIDWPIEPGRAVLSEKDATAPSLAELKEQGLVFE